jgi:hypothetical protein
MPFFSPGSLETSQNGTHATSENTPNPSNLNESISDAETASETDDSSQDEDISDNEDSQSHLSNFSKDQNEIQSPNRYIWLNDSVLNIHKFLAVRALLLKMTLYTPP